MNLGSQAWSPLSQQEVCFPGLSCTQQSLWLGPLEAPSSPLTCTPTSTAPSRREGCAVLSEVWCLNLLVGAYQWCLGFSMASCHSQKTVWLLLKIIFQRDSYRGSLAGLNAIFASICRGDWRGGP